MGLAQELPGLDEQVTLSGHQIRGLIEGAVRDCTRLMGEDFRDAWQEHENRLTARHLDQVRDLRLTIRDIRRRLDGHRPAPAPAPGRTRGARPPRGAR
jgi:hypothetical protein